MLPQRFEPPLQPSNLPAPLPQLLALSIHPLALNTLPPLSTSLQGRCRPLLLPSVAHDHAPLLPALRLQQGVTPIHPSNVPAPLAHISAYPLQLFRPHLHPSAVNPPPHISALLPQRDILPLHPSVLCAVPTPPPLSVLLQGQGGPPLPPSAVHACTPILLALIPQLVEHPIHTLAVNTPPLTHLSALPPQRDVPPL